MRPKLGRILRVYEVRILHLDGFYAGIAKEFSYCINFEAEYINYSVNWTICTGG